MDEWWTNCSDGHGNRAGQPPCTPPDSIKRIISSLARPFSRTERAEWSLNIFQNNTNTWWECAGYLCTRENQPAEQIATSISRLPADLELFCSRTRSATAKWARENNTIFPLTCQIQVVSSFAFLTFPARLRVECASGSLPVERTGERRIRSKQQQKKSFYRHECSNPAFGMVSNNNISGLIWRGKIIKT